MEATPNGVTRLRFVVFLHLETIMHCAIYLDEQTVAIARKVKHKVADRDLTSERVTVD
jgi:hypothetical protein